MATVANTIKKIEKLTGNKVSICDHSKEISVKFKEFTLSFYANGRFSMDAEATCFYATKKARTIEDHHTDYFPGFFADNASQLFKRVQHSLNS
jgi:hypothetical protein